MEIAQLKKGKPYLFTNVARWGGKGDNLLKLSQVFNVPPGFIISSDIFNDWITNSRLKSFLSDVLSNKEPDKAYEAIRQIFLATELQNDWVSRLETEFSNVEKPTAVRSSSVNEDGSKNSFAGQHETVLGVTNFSEFIDALREVYSSLYTPRAIEYRRSKNLGNNDSLAVVVQKMISPSASGVAYSPSPNNLSEILIESSFGLCTTVVDGRPCDIYRVLDTVTGDIRKDISRKKRDMAVFNIRKKRIVQEDVPFFNIGKSSLNDSQIIEVAKIIKSIERSYGVPMDMEFSYEQSTGRLYILQARPLTGLNMQEEEVKLPDIPQSRILARSRNIRKTGIFEGPAVVVRSVDHVNREFDVDGDLIDLNKQFSSGYILLAPEVPSQLEQYVTNARAMVITECGTTGHAAAIATEKGLVYMGRTVSSMPNLLGAVRSGDKIGVAASKGEGILYRI